MAVAAVGNEIMALNRAACEALGIDPKKVTALTIHLNVGDVPQIVVTQIVETTEIGAAARAFEAHKLEWKAVKR